jgi:hypothetical protein
MAISIFNWRLLVSGVVPPTVSAYEGGLANPTHTIAAAIPAGATVVAFAHNVNYVPLGALTVTGTGGGGMTFRAGAHAGRNPSADASTWGISVWTYVHTTGCGAGVAGINVATNNSDVSVIILTGVASIGAAVATSGALNLTPTNTPWHWPITVEGSSVVLAGLVGIPASTGNSAYTGNTLLVESFGTAVAGSDYGFATRWTGATSSGTIEVGTTNTTNGSFNLVYGTAIELKGFLDTSLNIRSTTANMGVGLTNPTNVTVTIPSIQSGDVVVALVTHSRGNPTNSITSVSGPNIGTMTQRVTQYGGASHGEARIYANAYTGATLTNEVITLACNNSSGNDSQAITVTVVSGANTTALSTTGVNSEAAATNAAVLIDATGPDSYIFACAEGWTGAYTGTAEPGTTELSDQPDATLGNSHYAIRSSSIAGSGPRALRWAWSTASVFDVAAIEIKRA